MDKKLEIIQIGGTKIQFPEEIIKKFEHKYVEGSYNFISDKKNLKIFINDKYNSKKNRNIYILGEDALFLQYYPELLKQLPAYQIFFDHKSIIKNTHDIILKNKFAISVDFEDECEKKGLNTQLLDFTKKQLGYKLNMDFVRISEFFQGEVVKKGNTGIHLSGDFGLEMNQIVSWKIHPYGIRSKTSMDFIPEITADSEDIELKFKIFLIDQSNDDVVDVFSGSPIDFINNKKIITNLSQEDRFVSVSLYIKGKGNIEIGNIHFRNHFYNNSVMIPNGKRIVDLKNRNEEILYYFYPGDLKPPLTVYFSGYRTAEGFEGLGMMKRMGGPFILFSDPRLEGGNFYIGSESLERNIVKVIADRIKLLGFSNKDLILSGLSMGTFGALYYSSDFEPAAVIIGKPICSIGTVALNERLKRPEIWGTSLDMVLHFGGEVSEKKSLELDQKFWKKFNKGNFDDTIFAIAHMKNDDYDGKAFQLISKTLRMNSGTPTILQKGLIGRHNDNSADINQWFIKQFRNILNKLYGRKINYRL